MLEKATNKPDTYRPDLEGGMLRSTTQEQRIQQRREVKEREQGKQEQAIKSNGSWRERVG